MLVLQEIVKHLVLQVQAVQLVLQEMRILALQVLLEPQVHLVPQVAQVHQVHPVLLV